MALYAKDHCVKPAALAFKTVRKWLDRFDGKIASLAERSRAPVKRPRKFSAAAEAKIRLKSSPSSRRERAQSIQP